MSGESFTFGESTPEKKKKQVQPTVIKEKKPRTPIIPKPKFDPKELLNKTRIFETVINCIHIILNQNQRDVLEQTIGSYKVVDVRKWLSDQFFEALTK